MLQDILFLYFFDVLLGELIGDPLTPGLSSQYTQAVCLKHVSHLSFYV